MAGDMASERLRFIHASDIHLGAPFRGLRSLSPTWAERLAEAIPEAYDRMIEAAIRHKVDFVIIAGDIFDEKHPSYAHYRHFFSGLKRLSSEGITVYFCTGNHDPYASWQGDFFALPKNAHIFNAERPGYYLYKRNGFPLCVVAGRGFLNKVWPADEDIAAGLSRQGAIEVLGQAAAEAPFGVGVLHTGLDLDPAKAPTSRQGLLMAGFDYWALGHIHRRYIDDENNPRLVFSGCIQGRDIKEVGPRGVNLVTLELGSPNQIEFIPTASVVWQRLSVDISECTNLPSVTDVVMRRLFAVNSKAHCEEMISRITLSGTTLLHRVLNRPGILEDLRESINEAYSEFFCDALLDETTMPRDLSALMAEELFPSLLIQAAEGMKSHPDEAVAYLQDEFLNRGVPLPPVSSSDLEKSITEAQSLVLDLLDREEHS